MKKFLFTTDYSHELSLQYYIYILVVDYSIVIKQSYHLMTGYFFYTILILFVQNTLKLNKTINFAYWISVSLLKRCGTRVMSACEKGLSSCSVSFASGANDGEAYPKHWVAALVQMNCERKVADRLNSLGISNYVPVQEEVHQWSDRKKKIARVVIPMVVFANVDSKQEKVLRNLSFVYKLITYPGQNRPAVIPDIQIAQLRLMVEKSDSEILIQDISLRTGDKVRVTRGALKGLEGLVCSAGDNRHMVAIRLECLGYACVNIPITDIEQIK